MTYSCEMFGFENCGLFEKNHTQFLRSIIQARKSTPLFMVYDELGRYPIEITIKTRMINSSRKLLRIKVTPDLHLTYSKNWGNLGLVLKMKNIACISIFLTKHVKYTYLYLFKLFYTIF